MVVMAIAMASDGFLLVSHAEPEVLRIPRRIYSPSGQAAAELVLLRFGCDGNGMAM